VSLSLTLRTLARAIVDFGFGPRALRTFARTSYAPEYRFAAGGFRCARRV